MESTKPPKSNREPQSRDDGEEVTQKLFSMKSSDKSDKSEQKLLELTITNSNQSSNDGYEVASNSPNISPEAIDGPDIASFLASDHKEPMENDPMREEALYGNDTLDTVPTPDQILQQASEQELQEQDHTARLSRDLAVQMHEKAVKKAYATPAEDFETFRLPVQAETETSQESPTIPVNVKQRSDISRGKAILYASLLLIVVLNAVYAGYAQFIGPQGWAFVIGGPSTTGSGNPLETIKNKLHQGLTPGATAQATPQLTSQQYISLIVQNMTLDQKLGQMMIVQFYGPTYSLDISTMISQYHVGAVLLFTANDNITDKTQLKGLIQQMQSNSSNNSVPMIVAIDQEGGTVDRLKALDGTREAAADIGATNDPGKAKAAGILDAANLASYGFNLNLAPVVDVTNVYNPQLDGRTYGNNATLVTKMAQAYLQGLQQSGKVSGTLKHFPGLGDVGVDPHSGVPNLYRSKSDLEAIDWSPYRALIQQGNVHAIMVTHEIVHAIDSSLPSSLSYKLVTGILRNELGFRGVIMTDSLTMEGITAYYTENQAAAVAVEAGSDLIMGASTPSDVASMIQGIKQAIDSGQITQQRIDDSVRRILMLKYQMGLLPIPKD
jgi:beta-N-acetylhexosaminidase